MHTFIVQEKIEELLGQVKDTEAGTRGFVISNDPAFLEPFTQASSKIDGRIADLRKLLADDQDQVKTLDTISDLIERKMEFQNFIIHLKKTDNFKFGNREIMVDSKKLMDSIRVMTAKMEAEQNKARIINDLEVREATNRYKILSTVFSITVCIIMFCSLGYILWEIRSKKKVQNLLNAVLESSQSGIMSFRALRRPDGRIIDFIFIQINRYGSEMIGIKSTDLIGRSFYDTTNGKDADELFDAYCEVAEKNVVFRVEKCYYRNKIKTWFRIVAVKLDDGVTVTFDDISKEKGYESELKNFITELKRSNSELEQFAFVASHDLQEPLRKIQTFGDRLKISAEDKLSANSKVYIEKIMSAAGRMSALINDLLSLSRLTRPSDAFEKINLNKILTTVKTDLELLIQNKNAVIHAEELPVIEGIPSQLYQLMFNLIGNALKFSKKDVAPVVNIQVEYVNPVSQSSSMKGPTTNQPTMVKLIFTDNGIGFENQYADRIFEIFQRLNGKSEFEGTGIGLAICKRIATNHHGSIHAKGEINKGAEFTVELPLRQTN